MDFRVVDQERILEDVHWGVISREVDLFVLLLGLVCNFEERLVGPLLIIGFSSLGFVHSLDGAFRYVHDKRFLQGGLLPLKILTGLLDFQLLEGIQSQICAGWRLFQCIAGHPLRDALIAMHPLMFKHLVDGQPLRGSGHKNLRNEVL